MAYHCTPQSRHFHLTRQVASFSRRVECYITSLLRNQQQHPQPNRPCVCLSNRIMTAIMNPSYSIANPLNPHPKRTHPERTASFSYQLPTYSTTVCLHISHRFKCSAWRVRVCDTREVGSYIGSQCMSEHATNLPTYANGVAFLQSSEHGNYQRILSRASCYLPSSV